MSFKTIKKGDSNIFVKYLQYGLHIMCFKINGFDGVFGNNTYNCVVAFQKSRNLTSDGIVGNNTWDALYIEIYSIQKQLENKGYNPGAIDGIAGENTYNSIIKFQKENNLQADGMVGEKTKTLLFDSGYDEKNQILLKKGSKEKNAIINLQNLLTKKGYNCEADGIFGNNTYNSVIALQKDYDLTVDGIVGPATWAILNSDIEKKEKSDSNNNKNEVINNLNNEKCSNQVSENLIYFIKEKEGFAPNKYKCPAKKETLGYGMTGEFIANMNTLNEEEATKFLTQKINKYFFNPVYKEIKSKGVNNPLQREVDAFTSFAYNVGVYNFQNSTLLKKYVSGERGQTICDEFMKWVNSKVDGVYKVLPGLVTRRMYEWKIFCGSNEKIPGYNTKPNISIINSSGKSSGKVNENGGYGAKPY